MNLIKALAHWWRTRNKTNLESEAAYEALDILRAEASARAELLRIEQLKAAFRHT